LWAREPQIFFGGHRADEPPAETPLAFRALPGVTRRPQDLENFPVSADPFMN